MQHLNGHQENTTVQDRQAVGRFVRVFQDDGHPSSAQLFSFDGDRFYALGGLYSADAFGAVHESEAGDDADGESDHLVIDEDELDCRPDKANDRSHTLSSSSENSDQDEEVNESISNANSLSGLPPARLEEIYRHNCHYLERKYHGQPKWTLIDHHLLRQLPYKLQDQNKYSTKRYYFLDPKGHSGHQILYPPPGGLGNHSKKPTFVQALIKRIREDLRKKGAVKTNSKRPNPLPIDRKSVRRAPIVEGKYAMPKRAYNLQKTPAEPQSSTSGSSGRQNHMSVRSLTSSALSAKGTKRAGGKKKSNTRVEKPIAVLKKGTKRLPTCQQLDKDMMASNPEDFVRDDSPPPTPPEVLKTRDSRNSTGSNSIPDSSSGQLRELEKLPILTASVATQTEPGVWLPRPPPLVPKPHLHQ